MTIITTRHRYKRPPRKRAKSVAITGPAVLTIRDRKRCDPDEQAASDDAKAAPPPASADRKSAIVTVSRPGKRFADVPDVTPEEHKRRGDAADALFREIKRRIASKLRRMRHDCCDGPADRHIHVRAVSFRGRP